MASKRGSAILIEQAEARVNRLLPALAAFLGIEVAPIPTNQRDPILQGVQRAQWLADTLEATLQAIVPLTDAVKLQAEINRMTERNEALQAEVDSLNGEIDALKAAAAESTPDQPEITEPPQVTTEGAENSEGSQEASPDQTGEETTPETVTDESTPEVHAVDRDALKDLKLDELKEMAIDAGADPEAVAKMRAKDDVINAIAGQEITEP